MDTIQFKSQPPYPHLYFEHPESWNVNPSSGKDYKDILVMGPRNAEDTFSLALVVRFTQASPGLDLQARVEETLARKDKLRNFTLASRNQVEVAGHAAQAIEFSYLTLKLPGKVDPGQMKVCEKRILFLDGEKLVEIIYSATEDDYDKYRDTVEKIIQSIQFG